LTNVDGREIIDFRNVITHHYFGINCREIYEIIGENFPLFCKEFLSFTQKIKNANLTVALQDAKIDAKKFNRLETLEFLESLEKNLLN